MLRLFARCVFVIALSAALMAGADEVSPEFSGDRGLGRQPLDPTRKALLIGNNTYQRPNLRLVNAAHDAEDLGRRLEELGFDVEVVIDADRRAMRDAVDAFSRDVATADVALFFYAGHAVEIDRENYLLPVDFDGTDSADVEFTAYAARRAVKKIEDAGASLRIVILDACRNDPFSRSGGGGLAEMSGAVGTFIAYSTSPGQVAADNPGGRNGLFTAKLLEALGRPRRSLDALFDGVRAEVYEASDQRQWPWIHDNVLGEFWFDASREQEAESVQKGSLARLLEPAAVELIEAAAVRPPGFAKPLDLETLGIREGVIEVMKLAERKQALGESYLSMQMLDALVAAGIEEAGEMRSMMLVAMPLGADQDAKAGRFDRAYRKYEYLCDQTGGVNCYRAAVLLIEGGGETWGLDPEDAVPLLERAASEGVADAMYELGYLYVNGRVVEKQEALGYDWFERAAQAGDATAQLIMGDAFEEAKGGRRLNMGMAMSWWRKAAESGNGRAALKMGDLFAQGLHFAKDASKSMHWYQMAADAGEVQGMFNVAAGYHLGLGLEKNEEESREYLLDILDKHSENRQARRHASYLLGMSYSREGDTVEARKWLRQATADGHKEAAEALASLD